MGIFGPALFKDLLVRKRYQHILVLAYGIIHIVISHGAALIAVFEVTESIADGIFCFRGIKPILGQ